MHGKKEYLLNSMLHGQQHTMLCFSVPFMFFPTFDEWAEGDA